MRKLPLFTALLAFTAFIAAFPAMADFQAGLDAYQKGDYVGAAKEWRPLAEEGERRQLNTTWASCTWTAMAFRKAPRKPPIGSGEPPSRTTRRPSTIWAPCTAPDKASSAITSKRTSG